jgi:hypothetical protein
MGINCKRVYLGGLVGGVVWNIWSTLINIKVGMGRYTAMQNAGLFLKQPRYPGFYVQWIVMVFILAILLAHLYAWVRPRLGPGPRTALKVGMIVGFFAGFPTNFGTATWSPIDRVFPLAWMLDLWVGCILATLVAGALYKEQPSYTSAVSGQ